MWTPWTSCLHTGDSSLSDYAFRPDFIPTSHNKGTKSTHSFFCFFHHFLIISFKCFSLFLSSYLLCIISSSIFRCVSILARSAYLLHQVRPSVPMYPLGSHRADFLEIWYLKICPGNPSVVKIEQKYTVPKLCLYWQQYETFVALQHCTWNPLLRFYDNIQSFYIALYCWLWYSWQ